MQSSLTLGQISRTHNGRRIETKYWNSRQIGLVSGFAFDDATDIIHALGMISVELELPDDFLTGRKGRLELTTTGKLAVSFYRHYYENADSDVLRFMAEQGWILKNRDGASYHKVLEIDILDPRTRCGRFVRQPA